MAEAVLNDSKTGGVPNNRFYLLLVDPLLDRPCRFKLTKSKTVVGFERGVAGEVNWVLPAERMGVDVKSRSRSMPSTFGEMLRFREYEDPFKASELPKFELLFDETTGEWSVVGPSGDPSCGIWRLLSEVEEATSAAGAGSGGSSWLERPKPDRRAHPYLVRSVSEIGGLQEAGKAFPLKHGDSFKFVFPRKGKVDWETGLVTSAQSVRFTFVDTAEERRREAEQRQAEKKRLAAAAADGDKKLKPPPPDFVRLPAFIWAKIAAHLSPEFYLDSLALVHTRFTSAEMKKEGIPWRKLVFGDSFDSLRQTKLASPEAVSELTCLALAENRGSSTGAASRRFHRAWAPFLAGKSLRRLTVGDLDLLKRPLGPELERLAVNPLQSEFGAAWMNLSELNVLGSVRSVAVGSAVVGHDPLYSDFAANERICGRDFFNVFPNVRELAFDYLCPEKGFWDTVDPGKLKRITKLAVKLRGDGYLPLKRFESLTSLDVDVLDEVAMGEITVGPLPKLERLKITDADGAGQSAPCRLLRELRGEAPCLKFLWVEYYDLGHKLWCRLTTSFPALEVVYVINSRLYPWNIMDMLAVRRATLKYLAVESCVRVGTLKMAEVMAAAGGDAGTYVAWDWAPVGTRTGGGDCVRKPSKFIFSKLTEEEEKALGLPPRLC